MRSPAITDKIRGPNDQHELPKEPCADSKIVDGYDVRIDERDDENSCRKQNCFCKEKWLVQVMPSVVKLEPYESRHEEET